MQTKFKWTPKQRLMLIAALSLGVKMAPNIETAHSIAEDIYSFANVTADAINSNEHIQTLLRHAFELQQLIGKNNIYEEMLKLDKDDD